MMGALIGDIIGSVYEWHNVKTEDFPLFTADSCYTDDSVMLIAVADKLLHSSDSQGKDSAFEYAVRYKQYFRRYSSAGFGEMFAEWANSNRLYKQRSYGNGAAMRVCPIAYAFDDIREVLFQAKMSCLYTHNHPEAIKGAKAVAAGVYLARNSASKQEIRSYIERKIGFRLDFSLNDIRSNYAFDSRTKALVPHAIVAFLESDSFESAIRKAISIGGDSDTIASIAGGIAQAYYREIPADIVSHSLSLLDGSMKKILFMFNEKCDVLYDHH